MGKRDASHFITEYYTEGGKVELMIPTDATDDDFALLKDMLVLVEAKLKRRADRKTEPNSSEIPTGSTISKMEQVEDEPLTCSFSDCDNFKNPDYARCIECKRKQIELKTEPTISKMEQVDKDINVRSKDEPQSDDVFDYCPRCGMRILSKWAKDEPQTDVYEYNNGEWVKPDCPWE